MNEPPCYTVHIIRQGPSHELFGWQIRRHRSSVAIETSTGTFQTRAAALADSARGAARWALVSSKPHTAERIDIDQAPTSQQV